MGGRNQKGKIGTIRSERKLRLVKGKIHKMLGPFDIKVISGVKS